MFIDLFGKRSKAKAEQLAKDNASLTEKVITLERQHDDDVERINGMQDLITTNEREIDKLTKELNDAKVSESILGQKIDKIDNEIEDYAHKFICEVASDYPNITNGKLRAFVDSYVILGVDVNKKTAVKPEHWFAIETISRLQKFIDDNGLTVRKK